MFLKPSVASRRRVFGVERHDLVRRRARAGSDRFVGRLDDRLDAVLGAVPSCVDPFTKRRVDAVDDAGDQQGDATDSANGSDEPRQASVVSASSCHRPSPSTGARRPLPTSVGAWAGCASRTGCARRQRWQATRRTGCRTCARAGSLRRTRHRSDRPSVACGSVCPAEPSAVCGAARPVAGSPPAGPARSRCRGPTGSSVLLQPCRSVACVRGGPGQHPAQWASAAWRRGPRRPRAPQLTTARRQRRGRLRRARPATPDAADHPEADQVADHQPDAADHPEADQVADHQPDAADHPEADQVADHQPDAADHPEADREADHRPDAADHPVADHRAPTGRGHRVPRVPRNSTMERAWPHRCRRTSPSGCARTARPCVWAPRPR